jgi:hypothetical protein
MGIRLPLVPLLGLIALGIATNVVAFALTSRGQSTAPWAIPALMIFDTLLFTGLLYWTGGPFNPFSFLYLVQIALAAVVLRARWTWALVVLSLACSAFLFVDSEPLSMPGHSHADHILGIDDLRPLSFLHKPARLPLYAHPDASDFIRKMFRYIFDAEYKFGGLPQVEMKELNGSLDLFGARFEPVVLIHGDAEIYGFRFGSAAYLTDHSDIPESSLATLEGLDVLFLDALRYKPHPTHSTVEHSLQTVARLKPQRAFFTHICHDLAHERAESLLPEHVRLAYDGLELRVA